MPEFPLAWRSELELAEMERDLMTQQRDQAINELAEYRRQQADAQGLQVPPMPTPEEVRSGTVDPRFMPNPPQGKHDPMALKELIGQLQSSGAERIMAWINAPKPKKSDALIEAQMVWVAPPI